MADILVVDDDDDLRELLAELLRDCGHQVRQGRDGVDALKLVHVRIPDLLVLDVEMPQLDGPGLVVEMFVRNSGLECVPIVLTSGCVDFEAVISRVGTPYAIAKPYAPGRMLDVVARALADRIPPSPLSG